MTEPRIRPWTGAAITILDHSPSPDPAPHAEVDAEWSRRVAANPRLYDGPLLAVERIDDTAIICRRDSYKRLAVQPAVATGVEQLSVTGILTRDERAGAAVLLGRRAASTRIYGGLWELGPSGGVEPPPPGTTTLTDADLAAQLRREIAEEAGPGLALGEPRAITICHDPAAHSHDIVFRCPILAAPPPRPGNWEYDDVRWIPLASLAAFERDHELIPPTRALLRFLGWVRP